MIILISFNVQWRKYMKLNKIELYPLYEYLRSMEGIRRDKQLNGQMLMVF